MSLDLETLSQLSVGLIFVTIDEKITFFNKAAEKITGLIQDEVLGHFYADFFSDSLFGFSLKKALLHLEPKKTIFLNLKKNGNEEPIEVTFSVVSKKGILIEIREASEIRKLKKALDRNDRLKEIGEMGARLAHEIRNPLGGILGFAELLANDLKEDPKKASMAKAIIEGGRLLNRLVTNILHYARPLEVHLAKCDVIVAIEEMITLAKGEEKEGKSCIVHKLESPIFVFLDKELFQMAFLNLLRNAFEATPTNGIVEISVRETASEISISIKDQGSGIADQHLEKIFTPFFTTKTQGTGLGLSEAHKVITAHGGRISVVSNPQGSIFSIHLNTSKFMSRV